MEKVSHAQKYLLGTADKSKKWGYSEAIWLASLLFLTGLSLEKFGFHFSYQMLRWPNNAVLGICLPLLWTMLYFLFRQQPLVRWLGGVHITIVILFLLGVQVLIMGVFPQVPQSDFALIQDLGFNHVTSSWAFIFSMLFLLVNLWFSTLKKIVPFKVKNIGFFLNHAGLFVAVFAGFLGASDLQRLTMQVYEGDTSWLAINEEGQQLQMPLAITLHNFDIEEYRPKFGLADNESGKLIPSDKPQLVLIQDEGVGASIQSWEIEVLEYKSDAIKVGEDFQNYYEEGSAPAARVKASKGEHIIEGWISSGSFMSLPAALNLDEQYSLVMTAPEPKKFSSEVSIYHKDEQPKEATLEVNKPVSLAGWDIYQLSYDAAFGKWSRSSTFELVRDPWIVVVYAGIFMMLLGAVYTLWKGRNLIST